MKLNFSILNKKGLPADSKGKGQNQDSIFLLLKLASISSDFQIYICQKLSIYCDFSMCEQIETLNFKNIDEEILLNKLFWYIAFHFFGFLAENSCFFF